jgi:hypothetical protein
VRAGHLRVPHEPTNYGMITRGLRSAAFIPETQTKIKD